MASFIQYPQLFRVLRDDENPSYNGISAKNPYGNETVESHVSNGSQARHRSQYISTSATREAAEEFAMRGFNYFPGSRRIAVINTVKLGNAVKYIDLTLPPVLDQVIPLSNERARNFARYFKEVIIEGYIPAACIDVVYNV